MAMCEISGKKRSFGHNVSHAKNRTNRDWLPNVHKKRLMIDGKLVRVNVAARTMRTLDKAARMAAKASS
jgi:large subunit ribosomal protein L28